MNFELEIDEIIELFHVVFVYFLNLLVEIGSILQDIIRWCIFIKQNMFLNPKPGKLRGTWHKDRNTALRRVNKVGQDSTKSVCSTSSSLLQSTVCCMTYPLRIKIVTFFLLHVCIPSTHLTLWTLNTTNLAYLLTSRTNGVLDKKCTTNYTFLLLLDTCCLRQLSIGYTCKFSEHFKRVKK